MFLRATATAFLSLAALPAAAACVGESFLDGMSTAQNAALEAAVADMPYAEGLRWAATRGADTLSIVGTMHIYDPRLEMMRAQLSDTVAQADLVMLEATPEEQAALEALITTDPGRLFIVDGPTLPELLDEETWQMVSDAVSERGIPPFMAAKMQPWYLSVTLAIPACAMDDLLAGAHGLDHMISEDAEAAGVPMQALEPYTTLFDIFEDAPVEEQISMLRANMLIPELQQQMFVSMLDRYFAEDIGRLWEMSRIALSEVPDLDPAEASAMFEEMSSAFLDIRNQNWMPVIAEATAAHDDIVIAVGAAHLIGEQGILQLLENDGWTIIRVE